MAKVSVLETLKTKFKTMPTKRVRNAQGVMQTIPNISITSTHLLAHLFFNILKEKPGRVGKSGIPSLDAQTLSDFQSPLAAKIVEFRSLERTLSSFKNAQAYVKPYKAFKILHPEGSPEIDLESPRGLVFFNPIAYDNVERIFSVAEQSIPLNVDKQARNAFEVPAAQVGIEEISDPLTFTLLSLAEEGE